VNLGEDATTVRKFADHYRVSFPLVLDREARTPRLFGLWGHPSTVLIDRSGRIVALVRGERDWESDAARRVVGRLLEDG
jgi:peroxiredoxin